MSLLRNLPRYVAGSGLAIASTSCVYNLYNPLNVIWDLDETLVSSEEKPIANPKPGKEYVIRKSADVVEHIDDDGLHFLTTARPFAITMLRFLRLLPGCEQFVSTSASIGYMNNVLEMLDPQGRLFKIATAGQSSRGKNVFDTLPPGRDPALRRTILVDNRASCHTPQPQNGLVVTDFVHPCCDLVLMDPVVVGKEIGRFPAAISTTQQMEAKLFKSAASRQKEVATCMNADDSEVALAIRGSARVHDLAQSAAASGAEFLVVYDQKRETSCFPVRSDDLPMPVVSVGCAAGCAMHARGEVRVAIQKADDRELVKVFAKLLLCWIVPDVRWVLPGNAQKSKI